MRKGIFIFAGAMLVAGLLFFLAAFIVSRNDVNRVEGELDAANAQITSMADSMSQVQDRFDDCDAALSYGVIVHGKWAQAFLDMRDQFSDFLTYGEADADVIRNAIQVATEALDIAKAAEPLAESCRG